MIGKGGGVVALLTHWLSVHENIMFMLLAPWPTVGHNSKAAVGCCHPSIRTYYPSPACSLARSHGPQCIFMSIIPYLTHSAPLSPVPHIISANHTFSFVAYLLHKLPFFFFFFSFDKLCRSNFPFLSHTHEPWCQCSLDGFLSVPWWVVPSPNMVPCCHMIWPITKYTLMFENTRIDIKLHAQGSGWNGHVSVFPLSFFV